MGFFSELFKPKTDDPSKPRETPGGAVVESSGISSPASEHSASEGAPNFRPRSAESRKKTSRLSLALPDSEIKLVLADVIHRIPSHFLKPGPHDLQTPLQFSIHDLFSDIARGRATVPLSKITKLCPEIFREQIDLVDDIEVHLPLQKLVGQVGAFPVATRAPAAKPLEMKPDAGIGPVSNSAELEKLRTPVVETVAKPRAFTAEKISLQLAAIVRTVPKEALIGELEAIDDSVRITLPYRLIEPQFASGKVELSPNDFIDALPVDYRIHFARGATVKIPIPLDAIREGQSRSDASDSAKKEPEKTELAPKLNNGSADNAIKSLVDAQHAEPAAEPPAAIATEKTAPILQSEIAAETSVAAPPPVEQKTPDAGQSSTEQQKKLPMKLHATVTSIAPENMNETASSPFAGPLTIPPPRLFGQPSQATEKPQAMIFAEPSTASNSFAALQPLFQTTEPLDAYKIAQLICRFPGITACVIVSKNSLLQSGAVPFDFDIEAFRATFSELSQSLAGYADKLHIGPAPNLALDSERFTVSFFTQPEACLCVFQNDRILPPDVRDKLVRVIAELARVI